METERGYTRSHSLGNSFWKSLVASEKRCCTSM